ncbi:MAG: AAA family ATPase [Pyrinomonadaceae bacterium]|nr:AAA family ATPase [Pyrinomonadaceae bacterium]
MINVTAIKLSESFDAYKNTDGEKAEFLEPVSKINIFVGSNNSGKSRFMRNIAKQTNQIVKTDVVQEAKDRIEIIKKNIDRVFGDAQSFDGTIIKSELERTVNNFSGETQIGTDIVSQLRSFFLNWLGIQEISSKQNRIGNYHTISFNDRVEIKNVLDRECRKAIEILDEVAREFNEFKFNAVYIPILRSLRHLEPSHTDFYLQKTVQNYFEPTTTATPEIFTGLTLYQRITDLLLGNNSDRKLISKYQEFISEKLFEGKSVALIPNQKEKVVIVKIGNEQERPIYDLGDGIQSAIILSFLPFVMQEQTFFFIEEPEMFLHPGLQRKLLNFYASLERHTFFMTTHSNHFLDITIDIKDVSIFTFRKLLGETEEDELTPDFSIEAVDSGCESSLELLGVRNSSVFLVNATIWVEGITDRWYLRKMLDSYMAYLSEQDELKMNLEEDTHYSFVEYGGANITHWSFLDYEKKPIEVKRLCAKAIVIIDEDGKKKEQRKEDLEKFLGDRLIILPCREVENLLPYQVIKEVVEEYEKDDELNIKDYAYEKYKSESLGKFIEDTMLKKNPKRKGGYKADSGTIKTKVDFCEKALPKIKYEHLPETTKEVVKKIYEFICSRNS